MWRPATGRRIRPGATSSWRSAGSESAIAGQQVLRDCTFTVPAGRVTAVAGTNGAGKTTVPSIIAGLLAPSEGEVLFVIDWRRVRARHSI